MKVLVESVVHHAIRQLLDSNSEHSLECTCTLLSSVGKYLDNIQGKVCLYCDVGSFRSVDFNINSALMLKIVSVIVSHNNCNWLYLLERLMKSEYKHFLFCVFFVTNCFVVVVVVSKIIVHTFVIRNFLKCLHRQS